MNNAQWQAFSAFREFCKARCAEWAALAPELPALQKAAAERDTPPYPLETAIVYNRAWDAIEPHDDIRLIVIGDNPGKEEQLACNNRYLVGQSGRIAEGFFARNPELGIAFRKNAIIINKTPVHTAKTAHLRAVARQGGPRIQTLVHDSQVAMAEHTALLHQRLVAATPAGSPLPELWLVGYAELKGKGIFVPYRDAFAASYAAAPAAWASVFVYQHFSMNRFLIDLKQYRADPAHCDCTLAQSLAALGTQHRLEIFGK